VWPSQANFVLARPPGGEAEGVYEALKARGILVRYFNQPRLDDKLRITVGTDEQNAALLAALKGASAT
jgi:histidinol-phosphate aminotransferase